MTHSISNLIHNAFLDQIGSDWVAVAANGHPIARATTEAAVRRAAPDAVHFICAADLNKEEITGEVGKETGFDAPDAEPEPNPVAAGLEAVVAQGAQVHIGTAETDADSRNPNAVGSAFDHDRSGAPGGSAKGDESTAHKGAVRRAAARAKVSEK